QQQILGHSVLLARNLSIADLLTLETEPPADSRHRVKNRKPRQLRTATVRSAASRWSCSALERRDILRHDARANFTLRRLRPSVCQGRCRNRQGKSSRTPPPAHEDGHNAE